MIRTSLRSRRLAAASFAAVLALGALASPAAAAKPENPGRGGDVDAPPTQSEATATRIEWGGKLGAEHLATGDDCQPGQMIEWHLVLTPKGKTIDEVTDLNVSFNGTPATMTIDH
ncbi:MAG TPA: hypothetical protein VK866_13155, partial [Acidimicrobiales bacterium]|nr:hypothetical protein [Acidimicrobiales bacterium]